jgi:transposase
MAAALLPDPLWDLVEPFLPTPARWPKGGRPRLSDRACLTSILFVLRSDIPWHEAFLSLGCALICWQSLRQTWSAA